MVARLLERRTLRGAVVAAALALVATSCSPAVLPLSLARPPAPMPPSLATLLQPEPPTPGHPTLREDGVRIPSAVDPDRPVPVLLALHGAGGSGSRTAERMADCAERNGWVLVAPSLAYRDYMDPEQVRLDDQEDLPRLRELLAGVRQRLSGMHLAPDTFVYGFSRGGQLAHRFALFYPDEVAGVAVVAAGSYTVPVAAAEGWDGRRPLAFPYGVSDLERYSGHRFDPRALAGKPFWIGVGAGDTVADQVPRGWDPYLGRTRLERATRFSEVLQSMGAAVSLNVFPGTGHDETAIMRTRACAFLTDVTPVRQR